MDLTIVQIVGGILVWKDSHLCPDTILVALRADCFDAQPSIVVAAIIPVQNRLALVVHDEQVEIAIVVVVEREHPLAGRVVGDAHLRRDFP